MQHVYLSYPEGETALAYRLVEELQAVGYLVFVDAVSDVGSMAWAAETRRAIRSCGAVVMLLHLAGPRRTGMRHEGIAARRRNKPVLVGALSLGDVPRYLLDMPLIDFSEDYETGREALLAALPDPRRLISVPGAPPRRRRPVPQGRAWWQRPVWIGVLAVVVLAAALAFLWLV